MSTSALHEIENKALTLTEGDRATLALHLIESLDTAVEAEVEAAWLIEAERRYQDYKQGSVKAVDADEAIARVRQSLG